MTIEIHTPELESLIRERMASGKFRDIEDVLIQALRLTVPAATSSPDRAKKTLGQFLLDSPLRDSGLKIERRKDYPEPIAL